MSGKKVASIQKKGKKDPKEQSLGDWRLHNSYDPGVSSNRTVTRSQTRFNCIKLTISVLELFADKSRHQPPGMPHLMTLMKGTYGNLPNTIILRSMGKNLEMNKDLQKQLDIYKKFKGDGKTSKTAGKGKRNSSQNQPRVRFEIKTEMDEDEEDSKATSRGATSSQKKGKKFQAVKIKQEPEDEEEDWNKKGKKFHAVKIKQEPEDEEEDWNKKGKKFHAVKIKQEPEDEEEDRNKKGKKGKQDPTSVDWRLHNSYDHGVSSNRNVTRSQTAFNRIKLTLSNLELFADKSRHQPPGMPHLMTLMTGLYGSVPNTIILRSTGEKLEISKDLQKELDKYKKAAKRDSTPNGTKDKKGKARK